MRLSYPSDIKIIQVPCSGRVDGVYVAGCLEGECHYISGNLKAKKRVQYVKNVLEELDMEPERVEMFNLSAGEGPKFTQFAKEMVERIKTLGPSPVNS